MNDSSPQGPTIPSSSNFSSNFTRVLKVTSSILGNLFSSLNPTTPSVSTTLSGGSLSGLNDPTIASQGATYAYALTHGGAANPKGPFNSVQYNNSGIFGGSANLLFNDTTNVLTANNISNGTVTISSNTISGLSNPTSGQEAATKNYVDNNTTLLITAINTSGSVVYPTTSVINGIIYRNNQTVGNVVDTLPTAAQIIIAYNAIVGTTLTFGIRNTSTNYGSIVSFVGGTGMTTGPVQNIFPGYQYNATMIVTNVTSGSEALTVYTTNNAITNTVNWQQEIGGYTSIVNVINITDHMSIFNSPTNIASIIGSGNVSNKIVTLNPSSAKIVSMDKPDSFMGVYTGTNIIETPFIWTTGGMDFYIINESAISGANITLNGITGIIPWTMDPNSNMIIRAGHTGWFMVALTVTNYPSISSLTSARIYSLGFFANT